MRNFIIICCAAEIKSITIILIIEQLSIENKSKPKKEGKTKLTETTNERSSEFVGGGPRLSSV